MSISRKGGCIEYIFLVIVNLFKIFKFRELFLENWKIG